MNLYIMDESFKVQYVIDVFMSLIWTKRYYQYGDFELYLPIKQGYSDIFQLNYYVQREDDDTIMIIEKIETTTDTENGNYIKLSGRSLESILYRRVIWTQTTVTGTAETRIRTLIDKSCISSDIEARNISGLSLETAVHDFGDKSAKSQYTGDNLYETIEKICQDYGYGFKISLDGTSMIFSMYQGLNSGGNQTANPCITFSPDFNNLLTSDYYKDITDYATIARVLGEGEGTARTSTEYNRDTTATGINRREVYVDAKDLQKEDGTTDAEYLEILQQRGKETLSDYTEKQAFDCDVLPVGQYEYKTDYNIGDIVAVKDVYGFGGDARIVEIIESWSSSGYSIVPTLSYIDETV